jgi:hypothetical protein
VPAGECANSRINLRSIHVWQAMELPLATIIARRIERSWNAARMDLK